MPDLSRRSLLGASPVLATAAVVPGAHAAADPLSRLATELRAQWSRGERDVVLGLVPDGRFSQRDPVMSRLRDVGRGVAALDVLKEVQLLPLEDQVHGAFQDLLKDAAGAFGQAVLTCRELAKAYLSHDEDAEEEQLHGALRVLRQASRDWRIPRERRDILDEAFAEAGDRRRPGVLDRSLKKVVRRIDKAEALVERARAQALASELLARPEPGERARIEAGLAAHGTQLTSGDERAATVLGFLLVGIAALGGVFFLSMGLCSIGCGDPAGMLLVLAGLGLLAVAIWGATRLAERMRSRRLAEPESFDPDELQLEASLNVAVGDGWTTTPVRRRPDQAVSVVASGRVSGPWGWIASPDGDGVAAGREAPLPGAPEVALVARVDGELFFLGARGAIPAGPDSPVELALNVAPADARSARGFFHVALG